VVDIVVVADPAYCGGGSILAADRSEHRMIDEAMRTSIALACTGILIIAAMVFVYLIGFHTGRSARREGDRTIGHHRHNQP
jgi:hypothetical protein